jgi:hypothetical protein
MAFARRIMPALIIVAALALYSRHHGHSAAPHAPERYADPPAGAAAQTAGDTDPVYHCDGRTYCSQMTSCAEAKYFLRHCPNVKMDGDHDGVPCESQWCPGG